MVRVKSHKRKSKKGKVYKVSSHSRVRKRPLGKKIRYETVGQLMTGFDEHGNIRGSRVIKNPESLAKNSSSQEITAAEIKNLDTKYYNREISYEEYVNRMNELLL